MYGRLREKKLTEQDMSLTCQNLKQELFQQMDQENRRINVDSAKKKAVLFGMEYEGFRQMVLGANLYNIKARELKDFSLGQEDRLSKVDGNIFIKLAPIYNATKTTFNNVETLDKSTKEQIYCENLKQADLFQQQIANLKCKNFREFRAQVKRGVSHEFQFTRFYHKPVDQEVCTSIDALIKAQSPEEFGKIFSVDFEISYFILILEVYSQYLILLAEEKLIQVCFIVQLLHGKKQRKVPKFLKKSERQFIQEFIGTLESAIKVEDPEINLNEDFFIMFEKVKSFYLK